jgi:hypothetical protein
VLAGTAALGLSEVVATRGQSKQKARKQRARAARGKAGKVDVCHRTGNGSYRPINVSRNALDAHLRHGDAQPGDAVPDQEGMVFGDDCSVEAAPPTPQRFCSPTLEFGPSGWAGWSCPPGMVAVGGGTDPAGVVVRQAEVAEPGSPSGLYPRYPHYTFTPPETGFVVQDDDIGDTFAVCVDCVPA